MKNEMNLIEKRNQIKMETLTESDKKNGYEMKQKMKLDLIENSSSMS